MSTASIEYAALDGSFFNIKDVSFYFKREKKFLGIFKTKENYFVQLFTGNKPVEVTLETYLSVINHIWDVK